MADGMSTPLVTRRALAAGVVAAAAAAAGVGAEAVAQGAAPPMAGTVPLVLPRTEFVYEAVFELARR